VDEEQQCLQAWNTSEMFKYKSGSYSWTGCPSHITIPGCVASQKKADRMNEEFNTETRKKTIAAKRCKRAIGTMGIVYAPLRDTAMKLGCNL